MNYSGYLSGWVSALKFYKLSVSDSLLKSFKGKSIDYTNSMLGSLGLISDTIKKLRCHREKYILNSIESSEIETLPGVMEFLNITVEKCTFAICTSSFRSRSQKILDCLGISMYFDKLFAYEDTLLHKPNSLPYSNIL